MDRIPIWVLLILIFLICPMAVSEEGEVKQALVQFMENLSPENAQKGGNWGWNLTSDPCNDKWVGVTCLQNSVSRIVLEGLNLTGILNASSICMVKSLTVFSLKNNQIHGLIPGEIGKCKTLTGLYLSGNRFSGGLPDSLSQLGNLKRLDISDNNLSDIFSGNPGLCGKPLSTACPPEAAPPPSKTKPKKSSSNDFLIYLGYTILGMLIVLFFSIKLIRKSMTKEEKLDVAKKGVAGDSNSNKPSETSNELKFGLSTSEYSMTSVESSTATSTLVVLTNPSMRELRFEDLLSAPAELLGRGKHGSLYKVMLNSGDILAVKRINNLELSEEDFRRRMQKINLVRHPHVLPPVAFYCTKQERLLVYEYQPNGSLFQLLHGSHDDHTFDWGSRLSVAASIAEGLAYMHKELHQYGIAHGNLKSTNIMFDRNKHMHISEYGLMVVDNQKESFLPLTKGFKNNNPSGDRPYSTFKIDVFAFGVILLELLTGKLVQNNGFDLATWVHSVVREEWTVEVFDRALQSEGASEERMVNLLQIALKCINPSPNERPSMAQVAAMIMTIKEEEEVGSVSFDAGSLIFL
ncbi:probable inactive receptor kinase At2g26730 isoform X2 [Juglans microcarpa x Juglans regia]|uniref:probable inactive receptor kinase At2g26730 isoform X2 n=1 Tax=Juglans microcarpa x Juglans regia TaxID=2249226 RepID=UPI001B7E70A4|nr:probable inactive receptor kinase At2g26730 isoform X2 [Juglans microcarpa x Juglans regia]